MLRWAILQLVFTLSGLPKVLVNVHEILPWAEFNLILAKRVLSLLASLCCGPVHLERFEYRPTSRILPYLSLWSSFPSFLCGSVLLCPLALLLLSCTARSMSVPLSDSDSDSVVESAPATKPRWKWVVGKDRERTREIMLMRVCCEREIWSILWGQGDSQWEEIAKAVNRQAIEEATQARHVQRSQLGSCDW